MKAEHQIILGARPRTHAEAMAFLAKRLNEIPEKVGSTRQFPLGKHHGLDFGINVFPNGAGEVYLEGALKRHGMLSRESQGPRAVMNAVERITDTYGGKVEQTQKDLELAHAQLHDYEGKHGAVFGHQAYMDELGQLRDRLKLGLSVTTDEGRAEVAEVAEQVKALKAYHTIESAPARERKAIRAERPVTARIRKPVWGPVEADAAPVDAEPEALHAEQESAAAVTPVPIPEIRTPKPTKPMNGHQHRIEERRPKASRMRMF